MHSSNTQTLLLEALCFLEQKNAAIQSANLNIIQDYQNKTHTLEWKILWQEKRDPYIVWLSEIMLQQTNISTVIPKFRSFIQTFPNIHAFAKASPSEIQLQMRGLGYYRRFRLMHEAAQILVHQPDFRWPSTYEEWLSLPGVGNYTAAAISSICFNEARAVVDGNIERILCRIFNWSRPANDPELKKIYPQIAQQFLIKHSAGDHNQALMELGQNICTPSKWECEQCHFQNICLSKTNQTQAQSPLAKIKKPFQNIKMQIVIPIDSARQKIGLYLRSKDAKFLKSSYGFLNFLAHQNSSQEDLEFSLDGQIFSLEKISTHTNDRIDSLGYFSGLIKHNITHHKIHARVIFWEIDKTLNTKLNLSLQWIPLNTVERNLLSNLDRKAWKKAEYFLLENGMRFNGEHNRQRTKKLTSNITDKPSTHKSRDIRREL